MCYNSENKSCIDRSCPKCQSKKAFVIEENIMHSPVTYEQFSRFTEKKFIKGVQKVVSCTKKKDCKGTVSDLIVEYKKQGRPYLIHEFRKNYPFKALSLLRDNLKSNKTLIRIDFSENYVCKHSK